MILRTAAQIWSTKSEHGFSATWEDLIFRRKAVSWVIAANSATFVLFKRLVGILHSVQAFYCGLDSKRSEMMLENPLHSAVACISRRRPSVFVPNMSIAAKPGEKQGQRSSRNSPKTASVGRRIWICPPFQQPGSEKT